LSHLNDPVMRQRLQARALEAIYTPKAAATTLPAGDVPALYDMVAEHIGNDPIVYLEFGVYSGHTMRAMTKRFTHPESQFFGFDSFEGLPEAWLTNEQGKFSRGGHLPRADDSRVTYVKGWFQNTLPVFLKSVNWSPRVPLLVHYDADLYSSTLFILGNLWPAFQQYYFIFDEFLFDECVALHDFALAYPVEYTFHAAALSKGGKPAQVFGHMKRVEFSPG